MKSPNQRALLIFDLFLLGAVMLWGMKAYGQELPVSERHVRAWQTVDYLAYELAFDLTISGDPKPAGFAYIIAAQAEGPAGDDVNPDFCYYPSIRMAHRASTRIGRVLARKTAPGYDRAKAMLATLDFALTEISEGYCQS